MQFMCDWYVCSHRVLHNWCYSNKFLGTLPSIVHSIAPNFPSQFANTLHAHRTFTRWVLACKAHFLCRLCTCILFRVLCSFNRPVVWVASSGQYWYPLRRFCNTLQIALQYALYYCAVVWLGRLGWDWLHRDGRGSWSVEFAGVERDMAHWSTNGKHGHMFG